MGPKMSHVLVPAAMALVSWATWARSPGRAERYGEGDDETIFVSIASYRDAECVETLKSLFENAKHPDRVFAGVCEQNSSDGQETCVPAGFRWHDQVRRVGVPAREAKGPTYARYLCSTLYRGETFFCQIDSHTRFAKHWDVDAVGMVRAAASPRAVLTHYPPATSEKGDDTGVPSLCASTFDETMGFPVFEAVTLPASKTPKPVPFTAGGFLFGPGTMVKDVPFDPDLPHLFQGEEFLYSARLWTSGYDFFTPTKNLVFHHYYRKGRPKFWEDIDYSATQAATLGKVRTLLHGGLPEYGYGMGTARSLDEYYKFARVDMKARTAASRDRFCK